MTERELTPEERIEKGFRDIEAQHRDNVHTLMGEKIGRLLIDARTINQKHRNYFDFNAKADRDKKIAELRPQYEALVGEIEREIRKASAQHDPVFMKTVRDHLALCDQEFQSVRGDQLSSMGADEEAGPR